MAMVVQIHPAGNCPSQQMDFNTIIQNHVGEMKQTMEQAQSNHRSTINNIAIGIGVVLGVISIGYVIKLILRHLKRHNDKKIA